MRADRCRLAGAEHGLSTVRLASCKGRLLFAACFFLVLGLPFLVGHAVDHLARTLLAQLKAFLAGCLLIPIGQAVAAKTRHVHQVDVLHLIAVTQMPNQTAECRCFQLGLEASVDFGHHRSSIQGRPRSYATDCREAPRSFPGSFPAY